MAIFDVTSTEIVQRCNTCGVEHHIALADLTIGVAIDTMADARVIPLPQCSRCRTTEFLIRSPDGAPEYPTQGTFGHLHRMLVDHLHAELVKKDRVHPALRDSGGRPKGDIARPLPQGARERWFPHGMKIERRRGEPKEGAGDERPSPVPGRTDVR